MESVVLLAFTGAYWLTVGAFMWAVSTEPSDGYGRPPPVGSRNVSIMLAAIVMYVGCLTAIVWISGGTVTWWISFWRQ